MPTTYYSYLMAFYNDGQFIVETSGLPGFWVFFDGCQTHIGT